jgi:hypothetical protein
MSTQHPSEKNRDARDWYQRDVKRQQLVAQEFTGIPDKIREIADASHTLAGKESIRELVTGRGKWTPGFRLENYFIEDDEQKGCFKIVICGYATDVLRAQSFIQRRISGLLSKSIGGSDSGRCCPKEVDFWRTAFSWVPLVRVTTPLGTTSLHLCIKPTLLDRFFPEPTGHIPSIRGGLMGDIANYPPETRAVLEFHAREECILQVMLRDPRIGAGIRSQLLMDYATRILGVAEMARKQELTGAADTQEQ